MIKWAPYILLAIVGVPFLVYVLSKMQMFGWLTAYKQFTQKEEQKDAKTKKPS